MLGLFCLSPLTKNKNKPYPLGGYLRNILIVSIPKGYENLVWILTIKFQNAGLLQSPPLHTLQALDSIVRRESEFFFLRLHFKIMVISFWSGLMKTPLESFYFALSKNWWLNIYTIYIYYIYIYIYIYCD